MTMRLTKPRVKTSEVDEVEFVLRFAGRDFGIVRVVQAQGYYVLLAVAQGLGDVEAEGNVAAVIGVEMLPVQPDVGYLHSALEFEIDDPVLPGGICSEVFGVPADALKVAASAGVQVSGGRCAADSHAPIGCRLGC